jgi:protocatechuate 3,4-dioxygenase beta subunit
MMQRLNASGKAGAVNFRCAPREWTMSSRRGTNALGLTRREALTGAAATFGLGLAPGRSRSAGAEEWLAAMPRGAKMCVLTPEAVEGPFYFDPKLVRTDITEGHRGAPLALTLQVVAAADCAPIASARVDLWHADALGMYSGYRGQGDEGVATRGQTFLRGTQVTGADGKAQFATIYPGWYPGRTPHIHFKVLLDERSLVTGQLYFPDEVSTRIYSGNTPYRERKATRDIVSNEEDFIFAEQGGADTLVSVTEEGGSYRAALIIGVAAGSDKRAEQTLMLKIVSGGQTGVDRAALDVAIERGIAYGGWCPKGGLAEDMPNPPGLLSHYPDLRETPEADPSQRTEWNVRDSDRLMVLTDSRGVAVSKGTALAKDTAKRLGKPNIVIDIDGDGGGVLAAGFIGEGQGPLTLCIAGPRESEAPGIYAKTRAFLGGVLGEG